MPIVFTGARAGEKVREGIWNESKAVGPTSHPKIMRAARPQIDPVWLEEALAELERLVVEADTSASSRSSPRWSRSRSARGARRF